MMKTILPEQESIHCGALILVNAQHPIVGEALTPQQLIPVGRRFPAMLMQRIAAYKLRRVLHVIGASDGIVPVSAYRSGKEQRAIYAESLRDSGQEFTRKYVALPDHSEHQTGLAIDLGLNQPDIDFIRPNFPDDGICRAFRQSAPDFGFIERYARGKENVTGIAHEPWHFRYVGCPHAKVITENGLALEEYIDQIKAFPADRPLIYRDVDGVAEISYMPAMGDATAIALPTACIHQISGNNVDGFIVTIWRKR